MLQLLAPRIDSALAAAVFIVAVTLLIQFVRNRSRLTGKRLPPGEMEWPIGGLQYLKSGFASLMAYEGDGPRKARLLGKPTALLRHPDHVKMILNSDGDVAEVAWPTSTRLMLGSHSVTWATGAYHKALRRLLGPCFTPQAIEGYLPAIQRICERYCADWAEATAAATAAAAAEGSGPAGDGSKGGGGGSRLDIGKLPRLQDQARLLTFEVMSRVVAGFHFSQTQLLDLSVAFEQLMAGIFSPLPLAIPGTGFAKSVAARQVMVAALNEQIDHYYKKGPREEGAGAVQGSDSGTGTAAVANGGRVSANGGSLHGGASSSGSGGGGSVMERLMGMRGEDGQPLSRVALQDLGINLLFAGHETTAASIVRLMMRLRTRPEVFERMRDEQREAVAKHGDAITAAALRDMPYLDAVVKEGWRLDPIVPMVPRRARKDLSINGYDIPKGWGLWLGLAEVMKQAPTWQHVNPERDSDMDPRVFNPDRWRVGGPATPAPASTGSGPDDDDGDDAAASGDQGEGRSVQADGASVVGASRKENTTAAAADTLPPALSPGVLSSPIGMLPAGMLTFGGGARYCLGSNLAWAEMKVFLAVLVRKYDITAPLEHMDVKVFPADKVTSGFPIAVRPLARDTVAAA